MCSPRSRGGRLIASQLADVSLALEASPVCNTSKFKVQCCVVKYRCYIKLLYPGQ